MSQHQFAAALRNVKGAKPGVPHPNSSTAPTACEQLEAVAETIAFAEAEDWALAELAMADGAGDDHSLGTALDALVSEDMLVRQEADRAEAERKQNARWVAYYLTECGPDSD